VKKRTATTIEMHQIVTRRLDSDGADTPPLPAADLGDDSQL
jgi:hypothetical protein